MAWFKVDDHFWSHPKTAALSDAATALWLRAGSWSAGHLTDGRVPSSMLRFFSARRRSADELVAAGLWTVDGDTFVFHSWAEYQPSKEQVEAKRDATKKRVNAWRERQGNGVTNTSPDGDRNAPPDPTRPDPAPISTSTEVERGTRKRATRIPEPFIVTADMRADMHAEYPHLDINHSTKQFVDYWRSASGKNALKKEWVAAWRFWMRRDGQAMTTPRAGQQPRPTRDDENLSVVARLAAQEAAQQKGLTA
ncbi:hypothetical protein [Microbacterium sp. 16-032]|uniref:hypothetical protein n=1 Tax=Microbacterium sp. 16-032 TaxID=3239808 RepID=UPI0034E1B0C5